MPLVRENVSTAPPQTYSKAPIKCTDCTQVRLNDWREHKSQFNEATRIAVPRVWIALQTAPSAFEFEYFNILVKQFFTLFIKHEW